MTPKAAPRPKVWDDFPYRTWSLWGIMQKYDVAEIAKALTVQKIEVQFDELRKHATAPDTLLQEHDFADLGELLLAATDQTSSILLIECRSYIQRASEALAREGVTAGMATTELRHAKEGIIRELKKRTFVAVRPGNAVYIDNERLFGNSVYERFKGARIDVQEAGNCIALDLPTAAVFHLMRVAEHGLRALAKKLKVSLTHKGSFQRIEDADWNKVITAAKNRITQIRSTKIGPKREAQLELCSDAADHCLFMKDIWRNTVSHTKKQYISEEALGAFGRVKDFMVFLAEKAL